MTSFNSFVGIPVVCFDKGADLAFEEYGGEERALCSTFGGREILSRHPIFRGGLRI